MRFDSVIELVAVTYEQDAIGQQVPTKTRRTVYANEFSVGSREFYDARAEGLTPERQYQIRSEEYAGETLCVVDGDEYTIIRTERRGEWTRLTCERVLGNA
jgi:hypothetical protein